MAVLLDTCAVSEYSQHKPNAKVISFLDNLVLEETSISAVTLAEIRRGIEILPNSKRRVRLEDWYQNQFQAKYAGRVLTFDNAAAERWGQMMARLQRAGFGMGYADSLVAAIALAHDLDLVTRNVADFIHSGVRIINPWR